MPVAWEIVILLLWDRCPCLLLSFLLIFRHPRQPIKAHSWSDIENNIDAQDTPVSPAIIIIDANASQEIVGVCHGTVSTKLIPRSFGVADITSSWRYEFLEILPAILSLWCKELLEFVVGASNGGSAKCCRQQTGHKVCERIDAVHEDPEARKRVWSG